MLAEYWSFPRALDEQGQTPHQLITQSSSTIKHLYNELRGTNKNFHCTNHFAVAAEHQKRTCETKCEPLSSDTPARYMGCFQKQNNPSKEISIMKTGRKRYWACIPSHYVYQPDQGPISCYISWIILFIAVHWNMNQRGFTAPFSAASKNCQRAGHTQLQATSCYQKIRNCETELTNIRRERHPLHSTIMHKQ